MSLAGHAARDLQQLSTCRLPFCSGGAFTPGVQYIIRSHQIGTGSAFLSAPTDAGPGTLPRFRAISADAGTVWHWDAQFHLVHSATGLCLSSDPTQLTEDYPRVGALALLRECNLPLRIYG